MHRDTKIGLALGVLLLGIVAAFYFRNEQTTGFSLPKLENPTKLISRIAEKPVGPYITGLEAVDSDKPAPGAQAANTPKATEPQPWQMPEFLKDRKNRRDDDWTAQSRAAPDPIRQEGFHLPVPEHNKAWTISTTQPKSPRDIRIEPESRVHRVAKGDTLSGLASRYLGDSSRFGEIYDFNRNLLRSPNDLQVGMQLRIPPDDAASTSGRDDPEAHNVSAGRFARGDDDDDSDAEKGYRIDPKASRTKRFVPVSGSPFSPRFEEKPTRKRSSSTDGKRRLSQAPPIDLPEVD